MVDETLYPMSHQIAFRHVELFCDMVDRRKVFSLISSQDHCQRSSPSQSVVSMIWACAEPEFRPCWMTLCFSDKHYTTAKPNKPHQYELLVKFLNYTIVLFTYKAAPYSSKPKDENGHYSKYLVEKFEKDIYLLGRNIDWLNIDKYLTVKLVIWAWNHDSWHSQHKSNQNTRWDKGGV